MADFFMYVEEEIPIWLFVISGIAFIIGYCLLFSSILNLEFLDRMLLFTVGISFGLLTTYLPFYIYYMMEQRRVRKEFKS